MYHRLEVLKRMRWVSLLLIVALLSGFSPGHVAQAARAVSGPVVVRPGGAQLYDAPGGEVVTTLGTGTVFTATARSEDMLWISGQSVAESVTDDEEAQTQSLSGWLQVAQVIAVGVELLPVSEGATVGAAATPDVSADASLPSGSAATATESEAAGSEVAANTEITSTEITGTGVSGAGVLGTVVSGDSRLNVRSGPGTEYAIVAKALPGESLTVVGRTADGAWLQVERADGETGWVSAAYLQIAGEVSQIPVVSAISPPVAVTTPASFEAAAPSGAAVSDLSGTLTIQSSPGGMIYAYAFASGALWPLTNGFDPAISPDGQTVAFVREGGENGIYLIDIDGSNERLIWSGRTRLSSPKWSPDGQWILFTRSDDSYECIEARGSCMTLPTGPNGEEMSIPGMETTTRYWYNLARVDRDGNNYRDIASLTSARAADWNEAGIVYQSDAGLQLTSDTPDAESTLVIFDYLKPYFVDPDWQPNGGRIVYMGMEASHWELFVVNPDGSGESALTRPATTVVDAIPSNVAPAWSPDGQHIVFLSNRESNGEAGAWRVWVMDADGSNQRSLPVDLEINYTYGGEQALSWAS